MSLPCGGCGRAGAGGLRPGDCFWCYTRMAKAVPAVGGIPPDDEDEGCGPCLHKLMRDLESEPPVEGRPPGWARHEAVVRAHRAHFRERAAAVPEYPEGEFAGEGVVIPADGDYVPSAAVAAMMLRDFGDWRGPVEFWHRPGFPTLDDRLLRLVGGDVRVRECPARRGLKTADGRLSGWALKAYAAEYCSFERFMLLDADCYPVRPVAPYWLFPGSGRALFWQTWPDTDQRPDWAKAGVSDPGGVGLTGNQWLVEKRSYWRQLKFFSWLADHAEFYFLPTVEGGVGYGDEDAMRLAWAATGGGFTLCGGRPRLVRSAAQVCPGFGGEDAFVHRFLAKFADGHLKFRGRSNRFCPDLPLEKEAWSRFLKVIA